MGILDFLTGEFIDVIHWTDDTRDTMVWRFEREDHEIKYGAKLTVREGQAAVFVHEGQLADVFTPGLYMLETNNMPILTTLQHWDHGFKSPFKSEIYYVNTTRFNDLKWGTKNPIMLRDPEFGPTRIRAYGTYSVRVTDPAKFLTEIVGTDGEFTMDEISYQVRNIIVQEFSRVIAASGIPVLDMAANTTDMKYAAAEALRQGGEASGAMGAGLGAGMGMAMAGRMAGPWGAGPAVAPVAPPPPPVEKVWHIAEAGKTKGPFSRATMGQMVAKGEVTRETHVWTAGQDGWKTADDVAELAQLFTVMPPPPPGA